MRFLPKKEIIIFDLEFAEPQVCAANGWPIEIFEIGACKVDHLLNEKKWFQTFIRPTRLEYLTPSHTMLTGIKKSHLENAPDFQQAGKMFLDFCGYTPLMSWSVADFNRLHSSYGEWPFVFPFFDALSFTAGILAETDYAIKSYSLTSLCEFFGLKKPTHGAVQDTLCVIELLRKIMNPDFPASEAS